MGLARKVGWVWLEKLVGFCWKCWLSWTAIMVGFGWRSWLGLDRKVGWIWIAKLVWFGCKSLYKNQGYVELEFAISTLGWEKRLGKILYH